MQIRQFQTKTIDISSIIDPEFVMRDPCLNCSLPFDCNEADPGCKYQNALSQRTVPIDRTFREAHLPLALRRQREKRRKTWTGSKQRKASQPELANL